MSIKISKPLILSCLIICIIVISSSVFAQSGREKITLEGTFEKTYSLDPDGRFSIDNHNGNIEIESWDKNEVEVYVRERRGSWDEEIEISITSRSDRLSIVTRFPDRERFNWNEGRRAEAHYRIKVPKNAQVYAESHNGEIKVSSIDGELEVDTHNGSIDIRDINNNVRIESHNGDIEVINIKGEVNTSTHNGNIWIGNSVGEEVYAKTHNGRITGDIDVDPSGRYEFEAYNGNVKIDIPEDSKANVEIYARVRNLRSDFDMEERSRSRSSSRDRSYYRNDDNKRTRIYGKINGGGALLKISTNNGRIDLRKK
ncbi:MAG: DUF4097 domain-containing protein [bacterium]|nr:DUF4097 domain-containing protein [bacterium]